MKNMYNYVAALLLCFFTLGVSQAQIIFQEDFSTGAGQVPPAGWANNDLTVNGGLWNFDNPGGQTLNAPITNPAAVFDSDFNGNIGGEDAVLVSPAFDASVITGPIMLSFDHYFRGGAGGAYDVEVFDGTTWNSVLAGTTSTADPQAEDIDITLAANGSAVAQVRFHWTGDFSWYWIVDNVTVYTIPDSPVLSQDPGIPTCAAGTNITAAGSPDPGVEWYWQASAVGTSTIDPYVGPLTVFSNGTYYIRAYVPALDVWADAESITISNFPLATDPPAPVAAQSPVCLPGTTISVDPAPVGYEYYWQGTTVGGTSMADDAATPYNVGSTGTYYVSAYETATQCWSNTVGVAVTVQTEIPGAPVAATAVYDICSGLSDFDIEATPGSSTIILNQSTSLGTSITHDGTGLTLPVVIPALPAGATITSAELLFTDVESINASWRSEIEIALGDMYTLAATQLSADDSPGVISPDPVINLVGFPPTGGSLDLIITESFNDVGVDDATFGEVVLSINYTLPTDVNWYDAAAAGTQVGTGTPFDCIGNSVLADPSTLGTYEFYAATIDGVCESATRTLVTVNVIDVNADLIPVDETCVGYNNGSFTLGTVECGTAPFSYSIDGGAFGPIPTDLGPGTYSVVIQDAAMLESNPIMVTIGAGAALPDAPTASTPVYDICSGLSDFDIEAIAGSSSTVLIESVSSGSINLAIPDNNPAGITSDLIIGAIPAGATVTDLSVMLNITHTFNGDLDLYLTGPNSTTIELSTDNGGAGDNYTNTVFSSNGVTPITGATAPMTGTFAAEGDMSTLFSVLNGTWTLLAVDDAGGDLGTIVDWSIDVSYTLPADLNWYDAATAGTQVGTGNPFDCIGNSVLADPSALGTYEFYAATLDGVCESATRALVTVNVIDVNAQLIPIDETCIGYSDGSFALGTVECGTAPFLYSIDGGAFGSIPTDLTAGTYSVVIQDAAMLESNPIMVTIGTTSTVIPDAPNAIQSVYNYCVTADPMDIEVEVLPAGCPIEINIFGTGWGDEVTWTVTDNLGATVLSGGPYGLGFNDLQTIPLAANGPYNLSISTIGTFNDNTPDYTVTVGGAVVFSGTATGGQVTDVGPFSCPYNGVPEWYSAAVGGDFLGNQGVLNALGTTVIPVGAEGTYEFYAYNNLDGCYSANATLVTVNLNNVNVDLDPIDADCNNAPTGSFIISTLHCGVAPFQFSVDGGAFGAIPTDLMAGTYTVVVRDANMDESAPYTVVIGEAGAPSDAYMEAITDNGGQVSWNTNGSETEWNVEWGLPGFTPGTGTEIGSATATDTFAIITGLDGNTNYDVYVSANCGAGTTTGSWDMVNWTTDCGIYSIPFVETFEDNSETRVCWQNIQEVGAADWTYQTGSSLGLVTTAYEGTLNARFVSLSPSGGGTPITKLESPRFDLAGQDSVAVIFAYAQEVWFGDQNTTKVYTFGPAATWTEVASYTANVDAWTVDTIFVADTTEKIAFEGINNFGHANVIDYVQVLPCTLNEGVDGTTDVCRLDGTFDLNSIVTLGESFGTWSFPSNPGVLNGSVVNVSALPSGTFDFYYIVKTPCAEDTTVATLTIFPPSTAGTDGTITACMNEPINLLAGLIGTVDLGGQWYDQTNNPTSASITASNFAGSYNFDYITTNGVCPNDTANIVMTVLSTCDYLDIQELVFGEMSVYPNPTDGLVFVSSTGNAEVFNYELTDVNGRVISVKEAAINGTETTEISFEKLEPGIYMIRVYNDSAEKTFRVVKQ